MARSYGTHELKNTASNGIYLLRDRVAVLATTTGCLARGARGFLAGVTGATGATGAGACTCTTGGGSTL